MYKGILSFAVALLLFSFAAAATARAEKDAQGETSPPGKQEAAPVRNTKAILIDATRVSTDKAVKGATEQKVKEKEVTSEDSASNKSDDPAVTELRRIPPEQAAKDKEAEGPENAKKPNNGPLKDVHGTVYGSSGDGTRNAGAAVGASTRGGKAAIHVEAQRTRETTVRH